MAKTASQLYDTVVLVDVLVGTVLILILATADAGIEPLAVFISPPLTLDPSPIAVFPAPPLTLELFPLAMFFWPPPMLAPCPVTLFETPPLTLENIPPAKFSKPPVMLAASASAGELLPQPLVKITAEPGKATLHSPPLTDEKPRPREVLEASADARSGSDRGTGFPAAHAGSNAAGEIELPSANGRAGL